MIDESPALDPKLFKATQKRVADMATRLKIELGLQGWDIQLLVPRGEILVEDKGSAYACIDPNWFMRRASLTVSAEAVSSVDDTFLERILMHEFIHLMISPVRPVDHQQTLLEEDLEERACEDLAYGIQRMVTSRLAEVLDRAELNERRLTRKIKQLEASLDALSSERGVA